MPRKPPELPVTTDEDISRVINALSRQVFRQFFGVADRAGALAEVCIRFAPVAIYCRHAREDRGEDFKSAARALRVPQYVLKQIEEGEVIDLELSVVERYASHLGFDSWFATWAHSNRALAVWLAQPPASRELTGFGGFPGITAAVRSEAATAPDDADRVAPAAGASRSSGAPATAESTTALQLEILLDGIQPPVWRRILVSADATLHQLHRATQMAMGWEDRHLYLLELGEDSFSDPARWDDRPEGMKDSRKIRLRDLGLTEGSRFLYRYDMGDEWLHKIRVERVGAASSRRPLPACLAGARACPPEDSGGAPGYEEMLKAWRNSRHPDHREIRDWLPRDFDPEAFDLDAANQRLLRSGRGNRRRVPLKVN